MKSWSESFAWRVEERRRQPKRQVGFYMTGDGPISISEAWRAGLLPK